jgi:membrane protein DedA with SNARE-associated domain
VATAAAALVWCLAFAAVGWGVGGSWDSFHHAFRYADYTAVAVVVLGVIAAVLVRRRIAARRPSP